MADEISIGKQAIKEVQDLRAELVKLSEDALKAGKNMQSISTPSGLNKNGADNAKTGAELDALKAKYTALNETIAKKAEQSRLAEIRLQQQREKSFDSFEKNAKKEQIIADKNASLYNKTQQQVNTLTKAYNDLAIKKERYNNLSANEEMRLKTLQSVTEKYNGVLKGTDANIGKYTRNVGNYASGYNALGNSINQLSREAPAFANSMNTGFMAISNNIPTLTDAIRGIRAENKALAAEGKPTVSVLKQLAGAIFSWQTLISVGVTLLTLYGGKIVEWARNLSTGAKAQEDLNKAMAEGSKNSTSEVAKMDVLYRTATNLNLSYAQRQKAVDQLQKQYPSYFANIDDEVIKNGQAKKSYNELKDAIIASSRAKAIEAELQKRASERLEKELELQQRIVDARARFVKAQQGGQDDLSPTIGGKSFTSYEDRVKTAARVLGSYKTDLENFYKSARNEDDLLFKALEDNRKKSEKYEADTISPIKAGKEKNTRVDTTPKVKELESNLKSIGTIITQINEEIGRLTTDKIVSDENALPAINFQLEQLIKLKGQIEVMPEVDLKIVNTAVKSKEAVKQLSEEIKNYLKSFSSEFMSNSGFSETFSLLNNEIEGFGDNFAVTFNAIAESAQEVFNFISNASQANFDAEKERLQSQYDVSLKYAGDNKEAQTKLAEDLEAKKKEITNRENKAKKKQAIFNIAIDTAQAIIGLWANPGFPAAIPLAIAVGALGLAQIAMVSSQKVPQYFMGGTHDGGLMMVNDGAGSNYRETIVTPDGKITQPTGRNVLMDAPKGTEIYTHDMWQNQLNDMLQGNGINWNNHQQSSGISKADLEDVMLRTIGSQSNNHTNFDGNGVVSFIEKRGNITRSSSRRGNGIGLRF